MSGNGAADSVRETIYRSCLYLDDARWDDFLGCCDESFTYAIRSFSPEIRSDMTYFSGARKDIGTMLERLPKHNTDNISSMVPMSLRAPEK